MKRPPLEGRGTRFQHFSGSGIATNVAVAIEPTMAVAADPVHAGGLFDFIPQPNINVAPQVKRRRPWLADRRRRERYSGEFLPR